jgi:hypothetical protein
MPRSHAGGHKPARVALVALVAILFAAPRGDADEARRAAILELFEAGDVAAAIDAARLHAEEAPSDADAALLLAEILEATGDSDADAAFTEAAQRGAGDVAIIRRVADARAQRAIDFVASAASYLASVDAGIAEALYLEWSRLEPEAWTPLARVSRLRAALGDRAGGLGFALAAVARGVSDMETHAELWRYLGAEISTDATAAFYTALARTGVSSYDAARCHDLAGQALARGGATLRWRAAEARDGGSNGNPITLLESAADAYRRAIECAAATGAADAEWRPLAELAIARYHHNLVATFAQQGDYAATKRAADRAVEALAPLLAARPAEPELRGAFDFIALGVFEAAGGEGGNPDAMVWLREFWERATALVEDSAEWWNNLAFFARESRDYEASYAAYERCIALAPDSPRYLNDTALILLYYLQRDLDRAAELFSRAVELGEAQYAAARAALESGEEGAEARLADLESAYGDALLNLALLRIQRDEPDAAERDLDRLDEVTKGRFDARIARIQCDGKRGDLAAARARLAPFLDEGSDVPAASRRAALEGALALLAETSFAGSAALDPLIAEIEAARDALRVRSPSESP